MQNITLSSFYNHSAFMKDVVAGERIISDMDKQLAMMQPETSTIKVSDIVVATGKGSVVSGVKGKVLDINMNGKFLSFLIDWDYDTLKKKRCKTFERLQDIKLSTQITEVEE